jgi:serine/threonine protein kinase
MTQGSGRISSTSRTASIQSSQSSPRVATASSIHSVEESPIEFSTAFPKQTMKFSRVSLEDLTITQTRIGSGNCAEVFLVHDPIGNKYALKRFKALPERAGISQEQTLEYIKQNVYNNRQILCNDPFAQLQAIPDQGAWYLMSYCEGMTLSEALKKNTLTKKQKQSILITYAEMLENIHDKGLCYVDVNPGGIILSNPTNSQDSIITKICDYDLMNTEEALFDSPFSQLGCIAYASREQLVHAPHRQISDFESLGLLIDHMYNGTPLRNPSDINVRELQIRAMNQESLYPAERLAAIPPSLHSFLKEVLIYDRGDTPSAQDLIKGLRKAA